MSETKFLPVKVQDRMTGKAKPKKGKLIRRNNFMSNLSEEVRGEVRKELGHKGDMSTSKGTSRVERAYRSGSVAENIKHKRSTSKKKGKK